MLTEEIAEKLRERRKALNLSQEQVANSSSMKRTMYNRVESGCSDFKLSTLDKILQTLKLSIKELINS